MIDHGIVRNDRHDWYHIAWTALRPHRTLYRTRETLDSQFAWVEARGAAARFATREIAQQVLDAYEQGEDLAYTLALDGPRVEEIVYPPPRMYDLPTEVGAGGWRKSIWKSATASAGVQA